MIDARDAGSAAGDPSVLSPGLTGLVVMACRPAFPK
jgi:hypothetical protein